tara:strand:+ start:5083 stop:5769 length:687 start_codon:yes stop_codon:yes gene_type:complete
MNLIQWIKLNPCLAIFWKDVMYEIRSRDTLVSVLVFSLLVIVVFNFGVSPNPKNIGMYAPGILWIAFVFGGVLGFTRTFAIEKENNALNGLLLTPVGRDAIYFGKVLSTFIFMLIIEIITFPIFAVLYNLPLSALEFIPVALLSTLGISAVGTLFSAMAMKTKAREVMLPLLFLPVIVPVLVASIEASKPAMIGGPWSEVTMWLPIIAAFDIIFLIVCSIAFSYVIQD